MARKILILCWAGSAYDSLRGLLELLGQQFAAQGLGVVLFTADGQGWPNRLAQVLGQGDIALAVTMSGIGADATIDGKLLWDVAKIPLFNWSCDHPCYFPRRHVIRSRYLLHGYVFPDHARYNLDHLKPNATTFAVHLGIPPREVFGNAPVPLSDRNGRIMFTKSGKDTNETEAYWRTLLPEISQILFAAAEELMHRQTGDFLPVLRTIAEPRGLFFDGGSSLAMLLIQELDAYIRFRKANLTLRAALDFPVDVYGTGWDHIPWDGARAAYHGPLTWRGMIERLPDYTGCLSTNPLVDLSVHDRVFFALAAGVPPITDSNSFSRANMARLEPYAFAFTPERIGCAIDAVLADPATAIARTEETRESLAIPFGLRRAASQIVQFASMHMLNSPVEF